MSTQLCCGLCDYVMCVENFARATTSTLTNSSYVLGWSAFTAGWKETRLNFAKFKNDFMFFIFKQTALQVC